MVGLNVQLWSNAILVLPTVMIELSNVRKKNKVPSNVTNADKQWIVIVWREQFPR